MRSLVEFLLTIWPLNRMLFATWRYAPFPRGLRSRVIRASNDHFLIGVMALVYDDHGRILLVRNTYDPRFPWSIPGGWMGRNEQPRECIERELREETGYEITVECLVDATAQRKLPSLDLVYRGRLAGGDFRSSAEVTEAKFFSLRDLPEGLTPAHRDLLAMLGMKEAE
jgi:8-oxo-dGTP diphosphatase